MKFLSSFPKKTTFSKRIWDITKNCATQKKIFSEIWVLSSAVWIQHKQCFQGTMALNKGKKNTSSWIFTLNSSWIGDAVTGVGDGLFSGSVRLGVSNNPVETDPEFNSSLSFSLPEGTEHGNLLVLQPCSHTSCSHRAQLWAKNGRIWLLGFFRTDYKRRKGVMAKCHFSIQPSQHSRVGTQGGQKAQQTLSGHLGASVYTSWINWSTSFLSVLEFHSKYFVSLIH